MCTLASRLLMSCGPTPILEYSMIGLGVAAALLFLTRPR